PHVRVGGIRQHDPGIVQVQRRHPLRVVAEPVDAGGGAVQVGADGVLDEVLAVDEVVALLVLGVRQGEFESLGINLMDGPGPRPQPLDFDRLPASGFGGGHDVGGFHIRVLRFLNQPVGQSHDAPQKAMSDNTYNYGQFQVFRYVRGRVAQYRTRSNELVLRPPLQDYGHQRTHRRLDGRNIPYSATA